MKSLRVQWSRFSTGAVLMVALGLTYGCGGATPSTATPLLTAAPTIQITVAPSATATTPITLTPSATATPQITVAPSATAPPTPTPSPSPYPVTEEAGVKILPRVYPPRALAPGTYRTDPSFVVQASFTIPAGWYGGYAPDETGFGVCQGVDYIRQDCIDGAISVDVLPIPLEQVVAAFQKVEGLNAGSPQKTQLGGVPAITFHPKPERKVDLGDALGLPLAMEPSDDQASFAKVKGTTVIIRTWFNEKGRRNVAQVLESFKFSP